VFSPGPFLAGDDRFTTNGQQAECGAAAGSGEEDRGPGMRRTPKGASRSMGTFQMLRHFYVTRLHSKSGPET